MKKTLLIFSVLLLFSNCKTLRKDSPANVKSFEIGKYYTSSMVGGYNLDFKENNEVIYEWYSDIFSFDRIGKFEVKNDTIQIIYEPLLQIKRLQNVDEKSIIVFKNKKGHPIQNSQLTIFRNGEMNDLICDEEARVEFNDRFEQIDSIYFNWKFVEFGIYPNEHKFCPQIDKIQNELIIGYAQLELVLEEDLIGHPISSNKSTVLIVGPNQLYPGLDYDPNTIYLGGILERPASNKR